MPLILFLILSFALQHVQFHLHCLPHRTRSSCSRLTFRTCNKGRLLRCISYIHVAIVSSFLFHFNHSLIASHFSERARWPWPWLLVWSPRRKVSRCTCSHGPPSRRGCRPWSLVPVVRSWIRQSQPQRMYSLCFLYFLVLNCLPGQRPLRLARCFPVSEGRRHRRTEGHLPSASVPALTRPGSSSRQGSFGLYIFAQTPLSLFVLS